MGRTNFYIQGGKTINVVIFVLLVPGEETFNNRKQNILQFFNKLLWLFKLGQ